LSIFRPMANQRQQQNQNQEQLQVQEIFGRTLYSIRRLSEGERTGHSKGAKNPSKYTAKQDKDLTQLQSEVEEMLMTMASSLRIYSKKYNRQNTLDVIKPILEKDDSHGLSEKANGYWNMLLKALASERFEVPDFSPEGDTPSVEETILAIAHVKEYDSAPVGYQNQENPHNQSQRNQPKNFPPQENPFNPQFQGNQPFNPQFQGNQPFNPQPQGNQPFNPQSQGYDPQPQGNQPFNPQSQGYNPQPQGNQPFNPQPQGNQPFNPQSQGYNPQPQGNQSFNPQSQGYNPQPQGNQSFNNQHKGKKKT